MHDAAYIYSPEPASRLLPEWYKKASPYMNDEKIGFQWGETSATIKKCIPVYDSMSAGYIIKTYCDIEVVYDGISQSFISPNGIKSTMYHNINQAQSHPYISNSLLSIPKFINAWSIKTDPGYSCLFIPPMHRESVFEILPGIVDTDVYNNIVHFPFAMKDSTWSGIIKAGTPIAQVIPFKRNNWEMEVKNEPDSTIYDEHRKQILSVFYGAYKNMFWSKKSYK